MPKPPGARRLSVRQVGTTVAVDACARHHRHLPRVAGGLIGIEVIDRETRWPVAWGLIGRPVSRVLSADGWVELTRSIVPDKAPPNCASAILGFAARWAAQRGSPIVTYTLAHESGLSLRAAGWVCVGQTAGGQFSRPSRPARIRTAAIAAPKLRWVSPQSLPVALSRGWVEIHPHTLSRYVTP